MEYSEVKLKKMFVILQAYFFHVRHSTIHYACPLSRY